MERNISKGLDWLMNYYCINALKINPGICKLNEEEVDCIANDRKVNCYFILFISKQSLCLKSDCRSSDYNILNRDGCSCLDRSKPQETNQEADNAGAQCAQTQTQFNYWRGYLVAGQASRILHQLSHFSARHQEKHKLPRRKTKRPLRWITRRGAWASRRRGIIKPVSVHSPYWSAFKPKRREA